MSKIDDNQIQDRLKTISQIKPGSESIYRAIQKTRQALINKENTQQYAGNKIWLNVFKNPVIKFAAAAVLMICFGYIGGRFSGQQPVDIEELRTAIRNDLTKEMDERWKTAFTANCTQLKDELHQQVLSGYKDTKEIRRQSDEIKKTIVELKGELNVLYKKLKADAKKRLDMAKKEKLEGAKEKLKKEKKMGLDELRLLLESGSLEDEE